MLTLVMRSFKSSSEIGMTKLLNLRKRALLRLRTLSMSMKS